MTVVNCRRLATCSPGMHLPDVTGREGAATRVLAGSVRSRPECPCVAKDSKMWKKSLLLTAGIEIGAAMRHTNAHVVHLPDKRSLHRTP